MAVTKCRCVSASIMQLSNTGRHSEFSKKDTIDLGNRHSKRVNVKLIASKLVNW